MNADPTQLKITTQINISGTAFAVARVPESGQLYFGSSDFKLYRVDSLAEKPAPAALAEKGHDSYVTGVTLAGDSLVSGSYDQRLIWWNKESGEQVKAVDAHDLWIRNVIASPDGSVVASVADDMHCKLWDAASGKLIHQLDDHKAETPNSYPSMLYAVAFSSDGKWIATGDKVGHIAVWETESGKKIDELEAPKLYTWDPKQRRHSIGGLRSLAFSHDGRLLAAGGIGTIGNIDHLGGPSRVEIFDWQKGERVHEIEDGKYKGLVEQMHFSPDGKWFIAAGGDHGGFFSIYNTETGKLISQVKAPMHIHEFVVSEDSSTAFAVGNGKVALFEFKSSRPEAPPAPESKA
jgi:WD40 repeat protein